MCLLQYPGETDLRPPSAVSHQPDGTSSSLPLPLFDGVPRTYLPDKLATCLGLHALTRRPALPCPLRACGRQGREACWLAQFTDLPLAVTQHIQPGRHRLPVHPPVRSRARPVPLRR